jgi:hypothetical protein
MNSRIALTAAFIGAAAGVALALRSERTRAAARRACDATSSATRARAAAAAERLDVMIRDIESDTGEGAGGNQWRYQTLVSARDALVAVGQASEDRDPVGAAAGNGAGAA